MVDPIFGKLTWDSVILVQEVEDPNLNTFITSGAAGMIPVGAVLIVVLLTWLKWWKPFFGWITSVDHKKIGIMYILFAVIMLFRGVVEGTLMRVHQATALNGGFLSSDHFNQLFTTHGTNMIFFVAMPFLIGLINIAVPLQIGARDVAFPRLNQISLGLTGAGGFLITISLLIGEFATGGWTGYPSYNGSLVNPGVGPDYWILSIGLSGIGSTLTGVNFAVTIYKMRTKGMEYMRMPLFTWTALCTSILLILAMPPLTACCVMLGLDRYLGFHFFTNDMGGNLMNFINLFWMFGHPEVYILILPAFGVMSEIASTFSAKRLYGYTGIVAATMCISVLSFMVWLHHFFTMGQSTTVNAAFGIATLLISIPTGVKVYDWLATLWGGRIRFTTPMIYLSGFFILFVMGGLSGVILANPTLDYQIHNSLFLVAHFHNVILPGTLFGILAAIHYWFPKMFGFRLLENYGRATAFCWIFGFCLTFLPLYPLGLMGMTRRTVDYSDPAYVPLMVISGVGALFLSLAFILLLLTFWRSIVHRKKQQNPIGDPWDGRTLEWWTPSPAPEWNFAVLPEVDSRDAFTTAKQNGTAYQPIEKYEDIEMPANTFYGVILAVFVCGLGFGLVWYIWWMAIASFLGCIVTMIVYAFIPSKENIIPAEEVRRVDEAWRREAREGRGITRDDETTVANKGLARPDELPAI
ncbi:cbb3-type cytochrome c oxidase subunit I [Puniceicoccus vermicola]|uniref:Cbb3-type cytochrome c oxidase subunit I n=1 Tax=Puniceicoccus vermicola TaxID=388746 RepID=A0A7X1AY01_9BACT|nr:cbb3-type cytochrome c oxidase subunit I [Puniceicoccus vermicola]MBC2601967.1 cbb3-type cytochrome c oxidase subunit I [Puniceicoccus vermicola]